METKEIYLSRLPDTDEDRLKLTGMAPCEKPTTSQETTGRKKIRTNIRRPEAAQEL